MKRKAKCQPTLQYCLKIPFIPRKPDTHAHFVYFAKPCARFLLCVISLNSHCKAKGKGSYPIFIKYVVRRLTWVMYIVLNGEDGIEPCSHIWGWGEQRSLKLSALVGAEKEQSCWKPREWMKACVGTGSRTTLALQSWCVQITVNREQWQMTSPQVPAITICYFLMGVFT